MTTTYARNDRVYVTQVDTDGPHGNATVTAVGLDGTGHPIATVMLDEYVTAYGRHAQGSRDASGRSWCQWNVPVGQLRKLEVSK